MPAKWYRLRDKVCKIQKITISGKKFSAKIFGGIQTKKLRIQSH